MTPTDRTARAWMNVEAALEIYDGLLRKAKGVFEAVFSKPTSYYDAEKDRVISMANLIFEKAITFEDIEAIARERPQPDIKHVDKEVTQAVMEEQSKVEDDDFGQGI